MIYLFIITFRLINFNGKEAHLNNGYLYKVSSPYSQINSINKFLINISHHRSFNTLHETNISGNKRELKRTNEIQQQRRKNNPTLNIFLPISKQTQIEELK